MKDTVPYVDRFPEGHEHEGAVIGRNAVCSRCQSEYTQHRVNPAYIDSIRAHRGVMAAESFKGSCEKRPNGYYQPPFCPSCTRKIQRPPHETTTEGGK